MNCVMMEHIGWKIARRSCYVLEFMGVKKQIPNMPKICQYYLIPLKGNRINRIIIEPKHKIRSMSGFYFVFNLKSLVLSFSKSFSIKLFKCIIIFAQKASPVCKKKIFWSSQYVCEIFERIYNESILSKCLGESTEQQLQAG